MATNPVMRVPEPSVESSASGVHWGARRRWHYLRFNKLRTSFGSRHRIALVTIGLSSSSVRYCCGNLADRDSMVGIRLGRLSRRSSPREVGRDSNRRGNVPRHRARISRLGFSDFLIRNKGAGRSRRPLLLRSRSKRRHDSSRDSDQARATCT